MFEFLKKKEEKANEETKISEFDIICPKCMLTMEKKLHGDIILDVCNSCGGTWFDKNEIEKLFLIMKNEEEDKTNPPKKVLAQSKKK